MANTLTPPSDAGPLDGFDLHALRDALAHVLDLDAADVTDLPLDHYTQIARLHDVLADHLGARRKG